MLMVWSFFSLLQVCDVLVMAIISICFLSYGLWLRTCYFKGDTCKEGKIVVGYPSLVNLLHFKNLATCITRVYE